MPQSKPVGDPTPTFVNRQQILRATGISLPRIGSLAIAGKIRVKVEPGMTPRYCLEDALRIVKELRPVVV
jgi:hypothetical protein